MITPRLGRWGDEKFEPGKYLVGTAGRYVNGGMAFPIFARFEVQTSEVAWSVLITAAIIIGGVVVVFFWLRATKKVLKMRDKILLVGSVLAVFIIAAAWYSTRPTPQVPPLDNEPLVGSLVVSTDKKVYFQGEKMRITVKNLTNKELTFANTSLNLRFEKWGGTAWQLYAMVPGEVWTTVFELGIEWHTVVALEGEKFEPGRYRVGTPGGAYKVSGEWYTTPPALAEFEVRESRRG